MHTASSLMDATITCHLLDAIDIRCPQPRTSGLPAHAWISPSRSLCHHGMVVCHAVHQKLQARQHRQHPGVTTSQVVQPCPASQRLEHACSGTCIRDRAS